MVLFCCDVGVSGLELEKVPNHVDKIKMAHNWQGTATLAGPLSQLFNIGVMSDSFRILS